MHDDYAISDVTLQLSKTNRVCLGLLFATAICALLASPFGPRIPDGIYPLLSVVLAISIAGSLLALIKRSRLSSQVHRFQTAENSIAAILQATRSSVIQAELELLQISASERFPLAKRLIEQNVPKVQSYLDSVQRGERAFQDAATKIARRDRLRAKFEIASKVCAHDIEQRRNASPAIKARTVLDEALARAKERRSALEFQWEQADAKLSWWGKLNHEPVDTKELDNVIEELQTARDRLDRSGDITKTNKFYDEVKSRALNRLKASERDALDAIPESHEVPFDEDRISKNAMVLAAMSVPVSAWNDISQAGDIYDALREVHGTYAGMSDFSIWLDTLTLPSESLAGLTSLAKGSYFEKLVEADTGGVRFEHFNHPDTDIVIDGIAYQIKATDSESYLHTVADSIPMISTSEIADAANALDAGYQNSDLEDAVDLALGGSVLDVGDTAVDAVLARIGGIGIFSILKGLGKVGTSYRESGDIGVAVVDGIGTAVVGSAKATVDTAELAYKAVMSRPSRFAGRLLLKGLNGAVNAIDRKLEDR